ncbi:MAG: hypothetical protein AB7D02_01585 [Candidatus Paceibacterota bacterium]
MTPTSRNSSRKKHLKQTEGGGRNEWQQRLVKVFRKTLIISNGQKNEPADTLALTCKNGSIFEMENELGKFKKITSCDYKLLWNLFSAYMIVYLLKQISQGQENKQSLEKANEIARLGVKVFPSAYRFKLAKFLTEKLLTPSKQTSQQWWQLREPTWLTPEEKELETVKRIVIY